jgi:hypothetical protein
VILIKRNGTQPRDADEINRYRPSEAAGSVTPNLKCYKSDLNSTVGEGSACASSPRVLSAVFTSLEPKPE